MTRCCVAGESVTWARYTVRGWVQVTEWAYLYSDGTVESVMVEKVLG